MTYGQIDFVQIEFVLLFIKAESWMTELSVKDVIKRGKEPRLKTMTAVLIDSIKTFIFWTQNIMFRIEKSPVAETSKIGAE